MAAPTIQPQWETAGAVQPPDHDNADAMNDDTIVNLNGKDAIREGKQRAKEIMEASSRTATPLPASPMPNGTAQPNGASQLSRKRSRDGTLKPEQAVVKTEDGASNSRDEVLLDRYLQRDMVHGAAMHEQGERSRALVLEKEREKEFYVNQVTAARKISPGSVFGYGYMGYGNKTTEGKTTIQYSSQRSPPKGRKTRGLHINRKDTAQQAEQHEELVPVRLDIELDKLRLRDTFTWNLHEKLISPDLVADHLLEDLRIPPESLFEVSRQVKVELQEQIQNFYPHIIVEDGPLDPGQPYFSHKDDEMRILIKINITIGRITLVDQFEWDINNPLNSPEEFARHVAWENGLSGEFATAIAHSIREQSQLYTKSLYLTGHNFDGRPVEDLELRDAFLPTPIHSAFRPHNSQKEWMPYMYEMSEAEFERLETSMMREHRAQKRQSTRRGGPALPDLKDRQRTLRSLIVHSVIPGAVETFETTGIPKTRRGGKAGRRGGPRGDVDVDTDDLDSEGESGAESPAPSALNAGGATRTRGMRGAATAAQAAMRANYGARSATPDSQLLAPPELPRTIGRRSLLRDESVVDDGDTLIVKLKIGKARLKAWFEEYRAKKRASEFPLSGYASQPAPPPVKLILTGPKAPAVGTPKVNTKPLPASRNTPQPNGHHRAPSATRGTIYDSRGGVETDHWPKHDEAPPPPPSWLVAALQTLRSHHPDADFESLMKPYPLGEDGKPARANLEAGAPPPPGIRFKYLPRIRCNDCPGKLYTAIPGKVIDDFTVHLKNRLHCNAVQERQEKEGR
ncbi:SWI/SNF chromatin-remodeling complex subunit [Elasticomyces elasticus]|nr:SWI/SNF chromatin-remodeling complex subunit [Elasticomyces elasticus]